MRFSEMIFVTEMVIIGKAINIYMPLGHYLPRVLPIEQQSCGCPGG